MQGKYFCHIETSLIVLQCKSNDWFLYEGNCSIARVNITSTINECKYLFLKGLFTMGKNIDIVTYSTSTLIYVPPYMYRIRGALRGNERSRMVWALKLGLG